jgi:hypothetical protein
LDKEERMKLTAQNLAARLASVALLGVGLACDRGNLPSAPSHSKAASTSASLNSTSESDQKYRWDIINFDFATGTVSAGGFASSKANDNSKITLTGSGTFGPKDGEDVTGGGNWQTFSSTGTPLMSGTYQVTALVRFELAPGLFPATTDHIGNKADAHAGLVFLQIAYSDGSRGVLAVSCQIKGTSPAVFEGITVSKGFVDFWNRESATPRVDGDRTLFHVLSEEED